MDDMQADRAEAQLRVGIYACLSETYDAAESVPTQLERGTGHAAQRGWTVAATFKDDGFSGFKEITRDGFGALIAAIEGQMASRSWSPRTGCGMGMLRRVLVSSFVPSSAYARLRADAREGGGTGQPAGRSVTVTALRWSGRARCSRCR